MFSSFSDGFADISLAPTDISYWKDRLAQKVPGAAMDRSTYVVIPSLGIVTPLGDFINMKDETAKRDMSTLVSGRDIEINNYLKDGVIQYPLSAPV
jgi:hypothetical protein